MTPKEKAIELYHKYFSMIKIESYIDRVSSIPYVKQCTLIAVDEIINMPKIASIRRNEVYMELEYWLEVKQEIEAL